MKFFKLSLLHQIDKKNYTKCLKFIQKLITENLDRINAPARGGNAMTLIVIERKFRKFPQIRLT